MALLAVALAVRLALAPFHGFFHDLDIYTSWGLGMRRHLASAYSQGTMGFMLSNYPPLMMDVLGIWVGFYTLLAHITGAHPPYDVYQSAIFAVYMKLPTIGADLATGIVLYTLARQVKSANVALVVAAAFLFAPPVIFDGVVWGQTDSLMALPLLLALLCAWKRRPAAAGALFSVAVFLKPHAALVGILLLVYLWRWAGLRAAVRFIASASVVAVVVTLPFLLPPHPQILAFLNNLADWERAYAFTSNGAFNLWWLLGPRIHTYVPYIGPLTPMMFGWLLFAPFFALAIWGVWRDAGLGRLCLAAAFVTLAFFDLTTLQLERYLFPALALFLVVAIYERRGAVFYVIASLTAFANMALILPLWDTPADLGPNGAALMVWGAHNVLYTLIVAEVNVALLAYVAASYALALWRAPVVSSL